MPVSRDNVVGLFWNILRRPPSEADISAHTRAESAATLGRAFIECHEFLAGMVRETFRWWLKREPVEYELTQWVNNFQRLGQVEGMKHLICSTESLRYCVDPLQDGSIVPSDKFWSGTVFGNQLIRWWKNREPKEPKEGLMYALRVNVGNGVFPGFQIFDMVAQEDSSIDNRVRRNYEALLGRDITPAEYIHWRAPVANAVWVHQIASSPEGLAHGLSLSRQRSVENLPVSNIPPAPVAQAVPPQNFYTYPEA
jgi:hypothetical protein